MAILLISDIHANLQALEAVLQSAPPWDEVWNLGDVVGYGANPNETTAMAEQLSGAVIRGNHDRACTGQMDLDEFSPLAAQAARWTQSVLTDAHFGWLAGLRAGPLQPAGSHAYLAHGSPRDEDQYLVSAHDGNAVLEDWPAKITFFGHTHVQGGFATNGEDYFALRPVYASDSAVECYDLPLRQAARYLLNPGSVGQPRDGDRRAAFAIYDPVGERFTWWRVAYDLAEAQRRIRRTGLPDYLADRLESGR